MQNGLYEFKKLISFHQIYNLLRSEEKFPKALQLQGEIIDCVKLCYKKPTSVEIRRIEAAKSIIISNERRKELRYAEMGYNQRIGDTNLGVVVIVQRRIVETKRRGGKFGLKTGYTVKEEGLKVHSIVNTIFFRIKYHFFSNELQRGILKNNGINYINYKETFAPTLKTRILPPKDIRFMKLNKALLIFKSKHGKKLNKIGFNRHELLQEINIEKE
ncbi:hypothetical protein H8356DRAFT_1337940 [Neocallimastix lanati (nom. inval.)]|nr:hypothetical protein H8356DRAFT_1337940 [Neocallimastix sp. JGI-2020a]